MFHGAGSSKELQLEYSQFGPVAAAGGGLLVLPDAMGEPRRWSPFGPQVFGVVGVDDLAFFDDVLRRVSQEYCIDPRRVLATGMSSGGFMAAAVGCQRSGRVAAVGAVTGTMWVDELCGRAAPVAYAQFHGTADEVVPYDGGLGTGGVTFGPIEVSAQSWGDQNGCSGEPDDQPVGREVVKRTWSGCDASTALFIVREGGHTWPGAVIASDVGHTTHDVDASTIIWDVFEASWPSAPPNARG
jgi:polyhydroxybutyrate depolymerase